ncbi:hypothetical protein LWI28_023763 [Acer negundo]|uniref:Gnk2-homologous domain-containing protein n=1 Tax=Acer negundo TaxID=4023 RepID=A0AAD5JH11_ACENE|nr:hypothetical protein LWI28_023763 [Acer negundo]KAK4858328.1 hypothetical protein QYF36_014679 [Acer negundo]
MHNPAMSYQNLLFFFFLSYMLISIVLTAGDTCTDTGKCEICLGTGNFTASSTYGRNRDLIPSSLASKITEGFYNPTIGQDRDKVYALALCRGDSSGEDCSTV